MIAVHGERSRQIPDETTLQRQRAGGIALLAAGAVGTIPVLALMGREGAATLLVLAVAAIIVAITGLAWYVAATRRYEYWHAEVVYDGRVISRKWSQHGQAAWGTIGVEGLARSGKRLAQLVPVDWQVYRQISVGDRWPINTHIPR